MARIDLVENYAIANHRKAVRESFMMFGEEVIACHMFHPVLDEGQPRCPNCYDDVYKQGDRAMCSVCYGTTFQGGIQQLSRCWAMLGTTPDEEERKKRGVWQPTPRDAQFEHSSDLKQNDYFFRVRRWTADHRPLEITEAFVCHIIHQDNLHTGNQYSQTEDDVVGQRGVVTLLDVSHVIWMAVGREIKLGERVFRVDGTAR